VGKREVNRRCREWNKGFPITQPKPIQYNAFELITAMYVKSYMKPCGPVKATRSFGGTYRLHLQGRRISQAKKQHEAGSKQILLHTGFLLGLLFDLKVEGHMFLRNVG
jgi:hypothetical protein